MSALAGKVAVVTGGSSGIGAAVVKTLAESGADVVVGYNSGEQRAKELIKGLPRGNHSSLQIDIEDGQSVGAAAAAVRQKYDRADILVNSAGFTRPVPHTDLEALDDALLDRLLIANVRGPFSVIRAFAPLMRATGDASIVNVSSISAFTGSGSNIGYCAAKAALDTMTMSLARVLGPQIRINCVSPAAVPTGFVAGRDRAAVEKIAQGTPLQRVVEPVDVANAVLACVTHLKTTTGSRIVIDGGRFLV